MSAFFRPAGNYTVLGAVRRRGDLHRRWRMWGDLSLADRLLGWHLGLGDLGDETPPCMTYACACVCPACLERDREPQLAPEPVRQPWDVAA